MLNTRTLLPATLALWLAAVLIGACAPGPGLPPGDTALPFPPPFTPPVETAAPYPPPLTPAVESTSPAYPAPAASETPAQTPNGPTPTPDLLAYQRDAWQSISPDGRYAARVAVALPVSPDGTELGETYHVLVNVVDFQDNSQDNVVNEWRNWGLGYTTPAVLGWTGDSQAFYLAESGVPDGCGQVFYENLRRVAAESGAVTPLALEFGRALSLSPDGRRLASVGEGELLVHDLESREETRLPFVPPSDEYWAGEITWSPDGERMLFSADLNPCGPAEERSSSLYLADLAGDGASTLLEDDSRQLSPLSWPLVDLAQLDDPNGQDFWLQVDSGQTGEEPPAEVAAAREALYGFFAALQVGDYAAAEHLYGGSYEQLEANNPQVDPLDRAALMENACLLNGFQCLAVYRAILEEQPATGEYRFRVTFDVGGQPFVLGPCCGADIAEMPPQSEFTYSVRQDQDGKYRVMGLPVFVP